MWLPEYLLGLTVLIATWGAALGAAWLVVDRRLPRIAGAPRALALAVAATAALVLSQLVPGALGVLDRWTALAAAGLVLAAAWRLVRRAPGAPRDDTPPPVAESGPVSWAVAALAVAASAVLALAELRTAIRVASTDIDSLTFHLPNVARWMQSGSLWQFDQFVPLQAHGAYPHNGDLIYLSVVEPMRSDAWVRLVGVPFAAAAALAAYAIGRELGAPRAASVTAAAAFGSLPIVVDAAWAGARTDPIVLAMLGAGVLFGLRHLRLRRTADLVLAGAALGLAFGTKWYGVSSAVVVVAVWAGATLLARRGPRAALRGGAVLGGLTALAGGFWLVRNAVETSSPLFPLSLPPLWEAPRDHVRECLGFAVADYATDGDAIVDYLYPAWEATLGLPGAVLLAGALAAAALGAARRDRAVLTASALVAGLTVAYVLTPYSALGPPGQPDVAVANTRYLGPALLVAAPLAAWVAGHAGRARVALEVVLLIALGDGLRRAYDVPAGRIAASALVIAAAAATVYGLYLIRARLPRPRLVLPVAAAVAAVALALAGWERLRAFESDRYRSGEPVVARIAELADAGDRAFALAGTPGVGGTSPVWPAFGRRMENRVEYLGDYVDGQLREYDDAGAWAAAVERGDYDYVIVGRGGYRDECDLPGGRSDDDAYARAAGLRPIAADERLTLYQVR